MCILAAASLTRLIFSLMPGGNAAVSVTLGILLTSVLYVVFLYLIRVLSHEDTAWFLRQARAGRRRGKPSSLEFEQ